MRTIVRVWAALILLPLIGCSKGDWSMDPGLEEGEALTAGYGYIAVEQLALSLDSTLQLMSISCADIDVDGRATAWSYTFTASYLPYREYHFTATAGAVRCDSISTKMRCGAARISKPWISSHAATKIAESQGGATFRRNNPNFSIQASLGEAVVPNSSPFWHFAYRSRLDPDIHLWISVDASATVE